MSEEGSNASGVVEAERDTLAVLVPLTLAYALIFVAGIVGNVSTCVVIARNRSMHTATNYYLFSLAISDLLLLVSGLPADARAIWYPDVYAFGETMCVALGLSSETAANATVLTITAFTVERYIAICHPFISHTMSKLSRVIKFIFGIWILALCTAIPQAIQYGVIYTEYANKPPSSVCTVKWVPVEHAFEISGFLFFVGPMTVITVLYILIGIKLRTSRVLHPTKQVSIDANGRSRGSGRGYKNSASQRRVIRMLVAVALSFFACWAPFHAQRLLAVYGKTVEQPTAAFFMVYRVLTYISGVLYFLSTAINPVLYSIMSNKFREAFKTTLAQCCRRGEPASGLSRTYSALAASRATRQSCAPRTAPRRPPLLPADSLDSARSISNSSLRDLDEEEFSGAELAVYMGQLNRNMGRIKRVEPI